MARRTLKTVLEVLAVLLPLIIFIAARCDERRNRIKENDDSKRLAAQLTDASIQSLERPVIKSHIGTLALANLTGSPKEIRVTLKSRGGLSLERVGGNGEHVGSLARTMRPKIIPAGGCFEEKFEIFLLERKPALASIEVFVNDQLLHTFRWRLRPDGSYEAIPGAVGGVVCLPAK